MDDPYRDLVLVPPAPLTNGGPRLAFSNTAMFGWIGTRVFLGKFRLPHGNPTLGPFVGEGDCLAPISVSGSLSWVDPTLPAEHGQLVIVRLSADTREHLARIHGKPILAYAAKLLWAQDLPDPGPSWRASLRAETWPAPILCEKGGMMALRDNEIIGPVVRMELDGARLYAS
jgi:hypothetical protein